MIQVLTFNAQWFPARRQDSHTRRISHQFGDHAGRLPNKVLAIIQHDHQMLTAKNIDKTWQQIVIACVEAEDSRQSMRHETGVRNRGKVYEPDTILEDRNRLLR